jgi:hypothetical protein
MEALHVPGMRVAAVKGDAVVWNAAFGIADTATGSPITARMLLGHRAGILDNWYYLYRTFTDHGPADLETTLRDYLLPGGAWQPDQADASRLASGSELRRVSIPNPRRARLHSPVGTSCRVTSSMRSSQWLLIRPENTDMSAVRRASLILLLAVPPHPAMSQDVLANTRFELGLRDDRLMMILTQTAPLVQQFSGFTAAVLIPVTGARWGDIRLDWTAALESGLAFDSTGLARWFVRAAEQGVMNERTAGQDSA